VTTDVKAIDADWPEPLRELHQLAVEVLGLSPDLELPDLLQAVQKRLANGAEPAERPLTPAEVAVLRAKVLEAELLSIRAERTEP
jgi:hypothetical protein